MENLRSSCIVLVLLSERSADREWINFEAGFGNGAGASVIPVTSVVFSFDAVNFPLKGYQGRRVESIMHIAFDVGREYGLTAEPVDSAAYEEELTMAERQIPHQSLVFTPFIDRQLNLRFELENTGNRDLEQRLMAQVLIPRAWVRWNDTTFSFSPNMHIAAVPSRGEIMSVAGSLESRRH